MFWLSVIKTSFITTSCDFILCFLWQFCYITEVFKQWHMVAQWHNGGTMAQWHNGTMALFLRKRFPALASVLSEFIYRKLRSCSFAFIADLSDTLSPFPDKTGAIERSGDIRIQGLRIMLTMSAV
jgi:hypothetical protein